MSEMKVGEFFVLPLTVNDTYAENELRDGNGDLVLAMEGNAHELRLIAKSMNGHDRLTEENQKLHEALECMVLKFAYQDFDTSPLPINEQQEEVAHAMKLLEQTK